MMFPTGDSKNRNLCSLWLHFWLFAHKGITGRQRSSTPNKCGPFKHLNSGKSCLAYMWPFNVQR